MQIASKMTKISTCICVLVIYTVQFVGSPMNKQGKIEIRAYIKGRVALCIPPKQIYNELNDIYGSSTVSYMTVCRWVKKFKAGISSIKDAGRKGRPNTSVTRKNVSAVKALVEEDGRYTVEEIANKVGISEGSAHTILTQNLGMKKVCARWVPHLLTTDQKKQRVDCSRKLLKKFKNCDDRVISNLLTGDETWVYMFEPQRRSDNRQWRGKKQKRPVIAKRQKSAKKVLYTIFFNSSGPVVQIPSKEGTSITGKFYKNTVLNKIKKIYKKKRPSVGLKGICLLHDNAPAHKSRVVVDFLSKQKVNVLTRPPYSPDLSPCDFFLFPRLKKDLSRRRYSSRSALGSAVHQCLTQIPRADYYGAFKQWILRLQKCISVKGEYFEGLK